jgi:hypothetical protein
MGQEDTMKRPTLDSILLATTDPDRLGAWYAAALEPEEDTKVDTYRVLTFGGFHVLIDRRADVSDTNPEPGRLILTSTSPTRAPSPDASTTSA